MLGWDKPGMAGNMGEYGSGLRLHGDTLPSTCIIGENRGLTGEVLSWLLSGSYR